MTYQFVPEHHEIPVYQCRSCMHINGERVLAEDCEGEQLCPDCGSPDLNFFYGEPAKYVSVALYATDRAYGGPEEGGWYYTCGERVDGTVRHFNACDFPQVADYVNMLERRYNTDARGSNLVVHVYDEQTPPKTFPERRPRYC